MKVVLEINIQQVKEQKTHILLVVGYLLGTFRKNVASTICNSVWLAHCRSTFINMSGWDAGLCMRAARCMGRMGSDIVITNHVIFALWR